MIKVTDEYFINVEEMNYIVCKSTNRTDKKTGKKIYSSIGYFGDIRAALKYIMDYSAMKAVKTDAESSLAEAIRKSTESYETVLSAIRSAVPHSSDYELK